MARAPSKRQLLAAFTDEDLYAECQRRKQAKEAEERRRLSVCARCGGKFRYAGARSIFYSLEGVALRAEHSPGGCKGRGVFSMRTLTY